MELQLGKTDETHIIRTIEYWDIERKRYPQYEHCAVIIAEEITARFFNVISLFNGQIPLIALQLTAYEVEGNIMLTFNKVLSEIQRGDDEEDVMEVTDRNYWMSRGTQTTMKLVDELFAMFKLIAPQYELKYNKFYMGIAENGIADNIVIFRAKKSFARIEIKLPKNKETDSRLAEAGFDDVGYDDRWSKYKIDIRENDLKKNVKKELIQNLLLQAYKEK